MGDRVVALFLTELRSHNCSVETLASLVGEYGGDGDLLWAYEDDDQGWTMFDRCIMSTSRYTAFSDRMLVDLIRLLVDEYPSLPSKEDTVSFAYGEYSDTLLQKALRLRAPSELVRLLVNLNLGALRIPDAWGNLPIHHACYMDADFSNGKLDVETVRFLAEADPVTLEVRGEHGQLPLHHACHPRHHEDNCFSPEVLEAIQLLIDAYPDALNTTDDYGETPILIAIDAGKNWRGLPTKLLQFLPRMIERAPDSVRVEHTNQDGSVTVTTALRRALKSSPNVELLSSLIKACPRVLDERDSGGQLPLHVAFSRFGVSNWNGHRWVWSLAPETIEAMQLLIDAHPTALEARDDHGRTPVMIAIGETHSPVPDDAVRLLLGMIERAPDSVRGSYPDSTVLAVACNQCCEPWLVAALIKAYPESLAVRDMRYSGGGNPLHVVFASRGFLSGDPVVLEATQLLIDAHPVFLNERDQMGRTPIMAAFSKGYREPGALNFLEQCIRQTPDSVRGSFKLERGVKQARYNGSRELCLLQ
jgi:ankyrin repeat protein